MTSVSSTLTVRVPLAIRRRGGRKLVVTPAGEQCVSAPLPARVDSTLVKALARAYRWKRMLDDGRYQSISEIAKAEKIDRGFLSSILRLTLLAPDIVQAILDGHQDETLGLPALLKPFPMEWEQQRAHLRAAAKQPSGADQARP